VSAVRNEVLDVAAVVAGYQREVQSLKAQLAALTGVESVTDMPGVRHVGDCGHG
jgi:prefoldin subunit 5